MNTILQKGYCFRIIKDGHNLESDTDPVVFKAAMIAIGEERWNKCGKITKKRVRLIALPYGLFSYQLDIIC